MEKMVLDTPQISTADVSALDTYPGQPILGRFYSSAGNIVYVFYGQSKEIMILA